MASSERLHETLSRLAAAEERAFAGEFLAPMVQGGSVRVPIAGVVCGMTVEPSDFEGWGVFRPVAPKAARLIRSARLAERRAYLEALPSLSLIVCRRAGRHWLASPAQRGDARFRIEVPVPVRLIEDGQPFETICVRFDGAQFWYDGPDPRANPAVAAWLRASLIQMAPPERLDRPGLSAELRAAYFSAYRAKLDAEQAARRDRIEERLRTALDHAGAALRDYREEADAYRVTYEVDGGRHVSVVAQADLSVRSAGLCLSGQDRRFDLASLVGVLREAQANHQVVPVGRGGTGLSEELYWDLHPPPSVNGRD